MGRKDNRSPGATPPQDGGLVRRVRGHGSRSGLRVTCRRAWFLFLLVLEESSVWFPVAPPSLLSGMRPSPVERGKQTSLIVGNSDYSVRRFPRPETSPNKTEHFATRWTGEAQETKVL